MLKKRDQKKNEMQAAEYIKRFVENRIPKLRIDITYTEPDSGDNKGGHFPVDGMCINIERKWQ